MKKKPIATAPKDRDILVLFPGKGWIEAKWDKDQNWSSSESRYVGVFYPIVLPSHGCGCCASEDPEPTFWTDLPA